MNAGDLLSAVRADLFDLVEPYLWSDEELLRFMDEGHRRLLNDVGGVRDTSSSAMRLTLKAGSDRVKRPSAIIRLERIVLVGIGLLTPGQTNPPAVPDLGRPRRYFINEDDRYLIFDKLADADYTLQLQVLRGAVDTIDSRDAEFDIKDDWVPVIGHWVRYRAYSKPDAESMDVRARDAAKAMYDEEAARAKVAISKARTPVLQVSYGGIGDDIMPGDVYSPRDYNNTLRW